MVQSDEPGSEELRLFQINPAQDGVNLFDTGSYGPPWVEGSQRGSELAPVDPVAAWIDASSLPRKGDLASGYGFCDELRHVPDLIVLPFRSEVEGFGMDQIARSFKNC